MNSTAIHTSFSRNHKQDAEFQAYGNRYTQIISNLSNTVDTILDGISMVIYKNKKGQLFYLFLSIREENDTKVRRIVQSTPIKGYHTLSPSDKLHVEADLNNGTNNSGMIPLEKIPKVVLNKLIETSRIEKMIQYMSGSFAYKNSKGQDIQVKISEGKIISATHKHINVSHQQKASIQKMIRMGKFEKFINLDIVASNDPIMGDIHEIQGEVQDTVGVQKEVSNTVHMVLDEVNHTESHTAKAIPIRGEKITIPKIKTAPEIKATQTKNNKDHYLKVANSKIYLENTESTLGRSIINTSQGNISEQDFVTIVELIRKIAIKFELGFSYGMLINVEFRKKLFKKLLSIFHPDKETEMEPKNVKMKLFQSIEHIRDSIFDGTLPEHLIQILHHKARNEYITGKVRSTK